MDSEKNIWKIFKTKAFALLVSDRNGIIVACARGFVLFEIPGKILPSALVLLGAVFTWLIPLYQRGLVTPLNTYTLTSISSHETHVRSDRSLETGLASWGSAPLCQLSVLAWFFPYWTLNLPPRPTYSPGGCGLGAVAGTRDTRIVYYSTNNRILYQLEGI